MHPVLRCSGSAGPVVGLGGGEAGGQAGELPLQCRYLGLGEVAADAGEAEVPASRAPVGAADPGGDDRRVARADDARGFEAG
ncbi:MAG: hypothetical protein M0030_22965 [Actinomycetota bacterium]|nr:hypothetical protein [Actinomycetota bacterium]